MIKPSHIKRLILILAKSILLFLITWYLWQAIDSYTHEENYAVYGGDHLILKQTKYNNGNIQAKRTYLETNGSLIEHGYGKLYFDNGVLEYFANYNKGKKTGSVTKYYQSGDIKEYWFYNLEGHALYAIQYDSLGKVTKEEGVEQRFPQVIIKDEQDNKVSLKVYSADIPNHYRNVYLVAPSGFKIDSILNCKRPFEFLMYRLILVIIK